MKGLKTLIATVAAGAALLAMTPASASAAAYSHYVACGVSQNAKPAHLCQKVPQKGRLLPQQQRHGLLHGLRQIPDQEKPLRAAPGSRPGDALREQDHVEHPRQTRGQLVRRGQKGRVLRLHRPRLTRR